MDILHGLPDPAAELQYALICLSRPGHKENWWAKMKGLGNELRMLAPAERLAIGYGGGTGHEPTGLPGWSIKLKMAYYQQRYELSFATVPELLAYLAANPTVARYLELKTQDSG